MNLSLPVEGLSADAFVEHAVDRKSTRLNSSHGYISYAVFCLKKKNKELQTFRTNQHGAALAARRDFVGNGVFIYRPKSSWQTYLLPHPWRLHGSSQLHADASL